MFKKLRHVSQPRNMFEQFHYIPDSHRMVLSHALSKRAAIKQQEVADAYRECLACLKGENTPLTKRYIRKVTECDGSRSVRVISDDTGLTLQLTGPVTPAQGKSASMQIEIGQTWVAEHLSSTLSTSMLKVW